jgi:hypothetical protein
MIFLESKGFNDSTAFVGYRAVLASSLKQFAILSAVWPALQGFDKTRANRRCQQRWNCISNHTVLVT